MELSTIIVIFLLIIVWRMARGNMVVRVASDLVGCFVIILILFAAVSIMIAN